MLYVTTELLPSGAIWNFNTQYMVISLDILPFCLYYFHLVLHIILDQFFIYKHIYILSFTHSEDVMVLKSSYDPWRWLLNQNMSDV